MKIADDEGLSPSNSKHDDDILSEASNKIKDLRRYGVEPNKKI